MAKAAKKRSPIVVLTAEQILAIPLTQPERLFTGDRSLLDAEYKALAKTWHPDRNKDPKAADVFAHITALRSKAETYLDSGIWQKVGVLSLAATSGKKYRIRYLKKHEFELGEVYIGKSYVVYCVRNEFKDLFQNAERTIRGFKFADDKMKAEGQKFLPSIKTSFQTSDRQVLVLNKTEDFVLLRDLVQHVGGKLESRHTAWVLSRLHNISCYLGWSGITHNAISLDTVLVSPAEHTAVLAGGWWYAVPEGSKLSFIPTRTLDLLPPDVLAKKKADGRVDLELVRAAGREMLGDLVGSTLKWNKDVPRPMAEWLGLPTSGSAVTDYRNWSETVLLKSFGPKRFVQLNVRPGDVYPQP